MGSHAFGYGESACRMGVPCVAVVRHEQVEARAIPEARTRQLCVDLDNNDLVGLAIRTLTPGSHLAPGRLDAVPQRPGVDMPRVPPGPPTERITR